MKILPSVFLYKGFENLPLWVSGPFLAFFIIALIWNWNKGDIPKKKYDSRSKRKRNKK
jgi:hypothetical protein